MTLCRDAPAQSDLGTSADPREEQRDPSLGTPPSISPSLRESRDHGRCASLSAEERWIDYSRAGLRLYLWP